MSSHSRRLVPLSPAQRRSLRRHVETLEGRIAPGCLLDFVAVTALGAAASSGRFAAEEQERIGSGDRSDAPRDSAHGADAAAAGVRSGGGDRPIAGSDESSPGRRSILRANVVDQAISIVEPRPHERAIGPDPLTALGLTTFDWESVAGPLRVENSGVPGVSMGSVAAAGRAASAAPVAPLADSPWPGRASNESSGGPSASEDLVGLLAASQVAGSATPSAPPPMPESDASADAESRLPRGLPYAEGIEREQSLLPYAITYEGAGTRAPTTGVVSSPAEYDPSRGVLFSYASFPSIVTDMVKELTEDPTKDDIAYVVVSSTAQQATATTSFTNAGANMSKVQFFIQPTNSVWIRDYGPHFITVDDALAVVDSHYYPNRPLDNFIPTLVGDNNFNVPTYDMGLYYSGGNFQPGPNRSGFVTSLVTYHNTVTDGFDASFISELYHTYQGIDTLHILPQLPFSVDGTGHIDMWMYLVDEDTVMISEFGPGANATAIQITNNAAVYMESLGFEVFRTPAWNVGSTHFTYTNGFRVNDRIFVPVYGTAIKPGGNAAYNSSDAAAMALWQAAAGPGVELIPIQCSQIIPSAGAIHCIVKQVPRYTGSAPAVNLLAPSGGEIVPLGIPYPIEWSAIDTNNVDPAEIRISVSYDGGAFQPLATTADTGSYLWTPTVRASSARIKITAVSIDSDQTEVVSPTFAISGGRVTTYDFASGAGVNKFGYGWQTSSWAAIQANPAPVGAALSAANYAALATSNATGGDADANRYIAPVPNPLSNESTHVFTFDIPTPIRNIAQIDVLWEGYADFCTQVELYVWDRVAQNWGDASGLTGNNRYLDSWAGNEDGYLTGSIRSDLSRYVDPSGTIRLLVYADRTGTNPDTQHNTGQGIETFHDYLSLRVTQVDRTLGVLQQPVT